MKKGGSDRGVRTPASGVDPQQHRVDATAGSDGIDDTPMWERRAPPDHTELPEPQSTTSMATTIVLGCGAGLIAGLAMNRFAWLVNATRGCEAPGATNGRPRTGRGMQPPQALTRAEDDAAVQVGTAAARLIAERHYTRRQRLRLGTAAHYTFSAALGTCYLGLAQFTSAIRSGYGLVYGTAVWAIADEGVIPAMGLSRRPRQLPIGIHLYSLAGHLVFGAALEAIARVAGIRAGKRQPSRAQPPAVEKEAHA